MESAEFSVPESPKPTQEYYENNYHYGWKPIDLKEIKLDGGVLASEIGLPPEIKTTEIPDVKWIANLMVYYKDNLAIAKNDPEKWFESSLNLRHEVIWPLMYHLNFYGKEWIDVEKRIRDPLFQHEEISKIREKYKDQSATNSNDDDFLLSCVELKYDQIKQKPESDPNRSLLGIDAKRTTLMPHGILTIDDWFSPLFEKGYMPANLFISARLNAYDITVDRDYGAWQKLNLSIPMAEEFDNEAGAKAKIPFPPNLTNGYFVRLPYLDKDQQTKYVEVYTFDQIERVPPKIFRDNADPENVPQNRIIMARNKDGKLEAVKPDLNGIAINEKKKPVMTTLDEFFRIQSPINHYAGQIV